MQSVDPIVRNNVTVRGVAGERALVFVAGFGGTQDSWRLVAPDFERDHTVVLLDYIGTGGSDRTAYDRVRYDSLYGYADDIIEVIDALGLRDVVFVGHSVSSMVGVLAANQRPDLIGALVLVSPSPRYLDADGYHGGFSRETIDELLASLDSNYTTFASELAPVIMGYPERPELSEALASSIRALDPEIAAQFARVTFLSDNRRDLADVTVPTLILQSFEDNIADPAVGAYVHEHIPGSRLVTTAARGHVPHLSEPAEISARIREFVG